MIFSWVMFELGAAESGRLFREALNAEGLSGYYNLNVPQESSVGPVIVRVPLRDAPSMDLRVFHETQVLTAIGPQLRKVPHLLYHSSNPEFSVISRCPGGMLDSIFGKGVALPNDILRGVAGHFEGLFALDPTDSLVPMPNGWPVNGDCQGVFEFLVSVTRGVLASRSEADVRTAQNLGIPSEPLAVLEDSQSIGSRQFRWVHSDIHRKNLLIRKSDVYLIDWELALVGDPVYDLAVHLHKMVYERKDAVLFLDWWAEAIGSRIEPWESDLDLYLRHERIKSAVVDAIRYPRDVAKNPFKLENLSRELWRKVVEARAACNLPPSCSIAEVRDIVLQRAVSDPSTEFEG